VITARNTHTSELFRMPGAILLIKDSYYWFYTHFPLDHKFI